MLKILLAVATAIATLTLQAQPQNCSGQIIGINQQPLAGVTLQLLKSKITITTRADGKFNLPLTGADTLWVTHVGYNSQHYAVQPGMVLTISLMPKNSLMQEVVVNTGYQSLPRERATGSFVVIDKQTINRPVASDIISRLDGNAGSLAFHADKEGRMSIQIRGESTIFSNAAPLIVVDDFPYEGDINNLNPGDVESVTLLRDAAAASIWGARAGNGVIVIKTKTGNINKKISVQLVANTSISRLPNPFYLPVMNTPDIIAIETMLFNKGYYDAAINNITTYPSITPVTEILLAKRNGFLTEQDAALRLDSLAAIDNRYDLKRILQNAVTARYALNISGGGNRHGFYFSAGYDKSSSSIKAINERTTLHYKHAIQLTKNLEFTSSIYYTLNKQADGTLPGTTSKYLYQRLMDDAGNSVVNLADASYRQSFVEQAMATGFLNWNLNSLEDAALTNNITMVTDTRIQAALKYRLTEGFYLTTNYQYQLQNTDNKELLSEQSYYVRNLINSFTQVNATTGVITNRPIPTGAILNRSLNNTASHNIRGQLNYSYGKRFQQLTVIAGAEARQVHGTGGRYRIYGYNNELMLSNNSLDYVTSYRKYPSGATERIYNGISPESDLLDRFRSVYGNLAYTLYNKYTFSASARKDASNLFGVKSNQRAIPLWSTGIKWQIHNETFFNANWINELSLRSTFGFNGNINKSVTAFATFIYQGNNILGEPYAYIQSPPNPELRWEKIRMLNIAIDFSLFKRNFTGSIEWYTKKGTDIFGYAGLDGSTGSGRLASLSPSFQGNVASMKGNGMDVQLNTMQFNSLFKWHTQFLFSYTGDAVTKYERMPDLLNLVNAASIQPVTGRPVYGIYSFAWAGLDPQTGDPQGWVQKDISKDYTRLINVQSIDELVFHGPAKATVTGSVRNNLSYKNFSFSFNISYKSGYYFWLNSIHYGQLFANLETHSDYYARWQQPGDEKYTNIPSMIYPNPSASRDGFYGYSEINVTKGDHIRLRDLQLNWQVPANFKNKKKIYERCSLSVIYNTNFLIWKANKKGVDPDYQTVSPQTGTFTVGLNIEF